MNILFVYSLNDIPSFEKPLRTQEQIYFGISYISSLLKKHGHKTRLVVLSRIIGDRNLTRIQSNINEFDPSVICFTSVSTEYAFLADISKKIKLRHKDIYLLSGGPHTSLNPDDVIKDDFDAICIGEGEYPTLELVTQLQQNKSPSNIQNLWIKNNSGIEKNPTRPFITDLDQIPYPDRDMWQQWIAEPNSRHSVLLGRGCPFQCTYCSNHALKKLASGPYVRFRSPDKIVEEIKELSSQYNIKDEIYLEIETIGVNRKWTLELCSKLEDYNNTLNKPLSFGANLRIIPKIDWEELFKALNKSNFKFINIGLESGSERVRNDILKRHYSNNDIIKAVNLARKHDFKICFFNLVGVPDETQEDFNETIKINRICQPNWHFLSIFYPYPGTDLYTLCKNKGYLKGKLNTNLERTNAVIDYPSFSKKEIEKNYVWFDYHVYKGHRPLYKIYARVLVSMLKLNIYTSYIYRALTRLKILKILKNKLKK